MHAHEARAGGVRVRAAGVEPLADSSGVHDRSTDSHATANISVPPMSNHRAGQHGVYAAAALQCLLVQCCMCWTAHVPTSTSETQSAQWLNKRSLLDPDEIPG
jgi:hypothetical protein